jgi:alanine or glycine:cation symporter, AGCS family
MQYLFGDKLVLPYRILFCAMQFIGALFALRLVWTFADIALAFMAVPNLIAILLLTGVVKKMTKQYVSAGKLAPPSKKN